MKNWYRNLSNPTRAALATALFSFLSTVGISLLGLLNDVSEWASGGNVPSVDVFTKVVVSAAVASAAGLVNYAVRAIQAKNNPNSVPQYQHAAAP